ncbi:site-specific integrase [Heyndrickxia faecalis]|uniref:site-specific integrase n=1 Tax=Heyndrickxia TaxID=2837504 RepID=UPI003100F784
MDNLNLNFYDYKRKNSKQTFWEYRITYLDPITKKQREKSKKGFSSKGEAKAAAREVIDALSRGFDHKNLTLQNYLDYWWNNHRKGIVAKNTYKLDAENIKNHIKPFFEEKILLKDITPVMYQEFINHLFDKGLSRRTVEIVHVTMHNAFEKAVTTKLIFDNPAKGVSIKGRKKKKEALMFIESDKVVDFLRVAYKYGYIYWIFFLALITSGMRKGEAAALQWTDIDFKNETISISKSMDFQEAPINPGEMFGDVKTYHSERVIKMSKLLKDALKFHIKYQNQNKLALGDTYHHDLNLVFCRNDGNYLPKSSLHNAFKRILKAADLPQNLRIHSLRHTYVVLQIEAGSDMKFIQEQLGHGSYKITADVYAHVSPKIQERNINNLDAYMDELISKSSDSMGN